MQPNDPNDPETATAGQPLVAAMVQVRCHVSGADVVRECDLEGNVVQLICPEFDPSTRLCALRQQASSGGPLSQFLERVAGDTLDRHDLRCIFC